MLREDLGSLAMLVIVAEEQSFTRAATRMGLSQSALSHSMRRLEAKLGLSLLARTTRSVRPTRAGEALVETLRPVLAEIETQISALRDLKEKPSGKIRITTGGHAARTILWPAIQKVMADYPDIHFELSMDQNFTDIVAGRFDAGVRLGESVEKDMISVRIGPDMRMAVVGSPDYLARHGKPRKPSDLVRHDCINLRMPNSGAVLPWEFEQRSKEMTQHVTGRLSLSDTVLAVQASAAGMGLAYVLEDIAAPLLQEGRLVRLLESWCQPFPGYYIYFPTRRQMMPSFRILIDALRYRS